MEQYKYISEKELKGRKRKNVAGVVLLVLLGVFEVFALIAFVMSSLSAGKIKSGWLVLACIILGVLLLTVWGIVSLIRKRTHLGEPEFLYEIGEGTQESDDGQQSKYSESAMRKQKVITDGGLSLRDVEEDLAGGSYVKGKFGEYRIGTKVMAFSKKRVFLIEQVLWMYVRIERNYAYGVNTATYRKLTVATRDKKIYRIKTSEQGEAAFKELVNKNVVKFLPDTMFGYTPQSLQRFKAFKKVRG